MASPLADETSKLTAALLLLAIVVAPVAAAATVATNQVNIDYGRSWPLSLVVDSARGVAYVDGESGIYPPTGFTFGIINLTSRSLLKVVPLPGEPGPMALDPSTGTVYVAGQTAVNVFNPGAQSFGRPLPTGLPISDLVYDNLSGTLLFTSGGSLYQLAPSTGRILGNATVGKSAQGIAVDWVNGNVYVADYLSASVSVFGARTLSPLDTLELPAPAFPSALVFDRARGEVYATTDESTVLGISTGSRSVSQRISLESEGINTTSVLALDGTGSLLFVGANPGNSVVEVDAISGTVLATFPVTSTVYDMGFDQKTGRLYASNYHHMSVITPVQQAPYPWMIAVAAVIAVGAVASLATFLVSKRFTPSGGRRDGQPSRRQTVHSWTPSPWRRPPDALRL
jgi:DNA-binding beta-propeller fold protein YncE